MLFAAVVWLAGTWSPAWAQETLGPEWRVHSRGLVGGIEHLCVTNGSQLVCGRTLPTRPGNDWTFQPQVTCDASGTHCQRYAPTPSGPSEAERAVILDYLLLNQAPPQSNPWLDASEGVGGALRQMQPPPAVQCSTRPNGTGWETTCR